MPIWYLSNAQAGTSDMHPLCLNELLWKFTCENLKLHQTQAMGFCVKNFAPMKCRI